MDKLKKAGKSNPFFLFLLPVFFVLHSFFNNYPFIPIDKSFILIGIYIAASILLIGLSWLYFKHWLKTCLFVFMLMSYQFFFGPVQDVLKTYFPNSFLYRYSFLLPLSLILIVLIARYLKKSKDSKPKLILYLNVAILTFIVFDTTKFLLSYSIVTATTIKTQETLNSCDSCQKPDIFLIVADAYAGSKTLKDLFKFENVTFEEALKTRNFHIVKASKSNYHFSPFSIASMLNQNYLEDLKGSNSSSHDMAICYATIKKNKTFDFLKAQGYSIFNASIFDLQNDPSIINSNLLSIRLKPIIKQTFTYRIWNELGYHLLSDFHLSFVKNIFYYKELKNNENLYTKTKLIASRKTKEPKFVYTHLLMPHYPYYFNSQGDPTPIEQLRPSYWRNKKAYLEYLQYTNSKLLGLVDHIIATAAKPPIIILMSDHGFRQYESNTADVYNFLNLNAVLFPDGNYSQFYDQMSNINQFRVIFNSQFQQQLSLLKDSTSFLDQ